MSCTFMTINLGSIRLVPSNHMLGPYDASILDVGFLGPFSACYKVGWIAMETDVPLSIH